MSCCTRGCTLALLAAGVLWLSGCAKPSTPQTTKTDTDHGKDAHMEGDHGKDAHKHGHKEDGHHDKTLTEKDIKMPDSFKAGVTRLEELHKIIGHHIEHGELAKVPHPAAEEMALVAKKMKELARKDVPEDKQTEAGRLCNEVAGYYKAIDEAADAGKKAETEAIHMKMAAAIENLKKLAQ